ncbi:uncharacterized protein LOC123695593 [Colias croceus]|uniref:uncharacterized protein LOC123695593 n=1 Tax=Colias crocea TaxID=72248 RepID=UPI001E27EB87|nr:uncharacterized protein LOC123695593 [Colias croceus]
MSCGKWYTIEDVTQDIARASGQIVSDLDAKYVIVGKQKPRYNTDEDELQDMHNLNGHCILQDENKPDLQGITDMIRLVDGYSTNDSSFDESDNTKIRETFTQEAVVISKLNPSVPPFVPKSSANLTLSTNSNRKRTIASPLNENIMPNKQDVKNSNQFKEKKDLSTVETKQNNGVGQNHSPLCDSKKIEVIPVDSRIDMSSLEPNEKEKLRENLITSISNTAQTSCVKVKRQRNLAIATLMKLSSDSAPTTKQDEVIGAKPNLITPQYYKTSVCDNETEKKQAHEIIIDRTSEAEETQTYMDNSIDKVNKWFRREDYSPSSESYNIDKTENKISNISTESSECVSNEPSANVQKSIEKVITWLKGPEEQAKSGLFLGPITFKKRENRKSPNSQTDGTSPAASEPVRVEPTKEFVPSAYASELSEKYMKRVNNKTVSTQVSWTNLEASLKARDEIIIKKLSSLNSE